jgi:hypothetical protein
MMMTPACTPAEEECDGKDNDCDDAIDEDVPPMPCGNDTPPCQAGAKVCTNGKWSKDCPGEVKPEPEMCDGIDNDCNGVPDEGCDCTDGMKEVCGKSAMTPCRKGMHTCVDGKWPDTCDGNIDPEPEECDGLDNDCDGTADDGKDQLCGSGQHCAGRDMCVGCTDDTHCKNMPKGQCEVNYCDTSRHECSTKEAGDGDRCTSPSGGYCYSGDCVKCYGSGQAQCSQGYECTSQHACVEAQNCGDRKVSGSEECDLSVSGTSNWYCSSTCKVQGEKDAWNSCGSCGSDTVCSSIFGYNMCVPNGGSFTTGGCSTAPGNFRYAVPPAMSALNFCWLDCTTAPCPSNTVCRSIPTWPDPAFADADGNLDPEKKVMEKICVPP